MNWGNPAIRAELEKVCEFWVDRGVDGLRLGMANLISKDQDFPNDPSGDGWHFYTGGPRAHESLCEMNRDAFTPRNLMTVGEMSPTTLEHCQQYATQDGSEPSMIFNFHHLRVDYPNSEKRTLVKPGYMALKTLFRHWQWGMHNQAWNTLPWCNHDRPRIVSRPSDEGKYRVPSTKVLAMVLHGMQGTPCIYQGEEIGMANPHSRQITDYRDVENHNMFTALDGQERDAQELLTIFANKSYGSGCTPMQWDVSRRAGFTCGEPWINPCDNATDINVATALNNTDSALYTYRKLTVLCKAESVTTWGNHQDLLLDSPHLWCYQRR